MTIHDHATRLFIRLGGLPEPVVWAMFAGVGCLVGYLIGRP